MPPTPAIRIQARHRAPVNEDGSYVLYWVVAQRRTRWNFGLQRAVEWARDLGKPLVVLEALRSGYRWASDRLHRFALEGMAVNARRFAQHGVLYHPYVEQEDGAGKGLLQALSARACVVVTDEFPAFFLPRMVAAAARQVPVRLEEVDANGLLPLRATDRVFTTAHSFRAFLQRELPTHLAELPLEDPLADVRLPHADDLPAALLRTWPRASERMLAADPEALAQLPIDHSVTPALLRGGSEAGEELLRSFIAERLPRYLDRNQPDVPAASGLSPYLHWGHLGAHEVFHALARRERWTPAKLGRANGGAREGWWRMSPEAEAFLDELITWREIGFNFASKRDDYDRFESLPGWALATLARHAQDPRPHLYDLEQLERAQTSDPLWNAAQMQLVTEGRLHNYLRMLWGKRVLEWTPTPRDAYRVLEHLNNKYALDGRDPNSYAGILWVFGRYDRAWGPERPIYGTVRYMSSENTARKLKVKEYVRRFSPQR